MCRTLPRPAGRSPSPAMSPDDIAHQVIDQEIRADLLDEELSGPTLKPEEPKFLSSSTPRARAGARGALSVLAIVCVAARRCLDDRIHRHARPREHEGAGAGGEARRDEPVVDL